MNKVSLMVLGLIVLVGISGGLWYMTTAPTVVAPTVSVVPDQAVSMPVRDLPEAASVPLSAPMSYPVTLSAFAEHPFQGSDFHVGDILDRNSAYTRYFITYKSGDLTISGIMNVPVGTGPFPILILNHGFIDPAVYTNGRGLKREQDYLARQGYVVIHPDYRNHAQSDDDPETDIHFRMGYVEDVINAVEAIKASHLPYIDPERIGMLGHSMGGGVTQTIMVTHPDLIDAVVLFAPVSADIRDNFAKWTTRRPEVAEKIVAQYGSPAHNPAFWDSISPIMHLNTVTAPVMIHHGTSDASVPLEWSQRLAHELQAQGKDVTLHIYPGEPHEFTTAWPTVMARTTEFFNATVKDKSESRE